MKEIVLTKGCVAQVDDDLFDWLNQWKWSIVENDGHFYAARGEMRNGKLVSVKMHREIMDAPNGLEVDHRNGNGLDNTRENLRLCTRTENARNKRSARGSSSMYLGVCVCHELKWNNPKYPRTRYRAAIRVGGKLINLGSFNNEVDAAEARDLGSLKYFGEFAKLNFPDKKDEYLWILEKEAVSVG